MGGFEPGCTLSRGCCIAAWNHQSIFTRTQFMFNKWMAARHKAGLSHAGASVLGVYIPFDVPVCFLKGTNDKIEQNLMLKCLAHVASLAPMINLLKYITCFIASHWWLKRARDFLFLTFRLPMAMHQTGKHPYTSWTPVRPSCAETRHKQF